VWERLGLDSVLEIVVAGVENGDVQFWYVRNSQGLRPGDGKHEHPGRVFITENDLDRNYVAPALQPGQSKEELLRAVTFSFRQGVVIPAAPVFNGFADLLATLYRYRLEGFSPVSSLDGLGQFARMRMEFLKRLCTAKYGIYDEGTPTPVAGRVHVYGVGRDRQVRCYSKDRNQVTIVR
jgi:hypothetical protein